MKSPSSVTVNIPLSGVAVPYTGLSPNLFETDNKLLSKTTVSNVPRHSLNAEQEKEHEIEDSDSDEEK